MAADGKTDGMSSDTVSRMGIWILTGELPQPMDESVRQTMTTSFDGSAPFPKASSEALNFLASIDESDLRYLLFEDNLVIVNSKTGKAVGDFQMMASSGGRTRDKILTVKAKSVGTVEGVPCGAKITARVTPQLETLKEKIHEYVKLDGCLLDRITEVIKRTENYALYRTVNKGEIQEKTEYSANAKDMRGFISEGANHLLQKLFLKKGVPENCQFLTMDYDSSICPVVYKSLGHKTERIGGSEVELQGIERLVKTRRGQPIIWHSFYNAEGRLLTRTQLHSGLSMKVWSSTVDRSTDGVTGPLLNSAMTPLPILTVDPSAQTFPTSPNIVLTGDSLSDAQPDLTSPTSILSVVANTLPSVSTGDTPIGITTIPASSLNSAADILHTLKEPPSAPTIPSSPKFLLTDGSSGYAQPDLSPHGHISYVVASSSFSVTGGDTTIGSTTSPDIVELLPVQSPEGGSESASVDLSLSTSSDQQTGVSVNEENQSLVFNETANSTDSDSDSISPSDQLDIEIADEKQFRYLIYEGLSDEEIGFVLEKLKPAPAFTRFCRICGEFINAGGVRTFCRDEFHEQCIRPWLRIHAKCPDCQFDFRLLL